MTPNRARDEGFLISLMGLGTRTDGSIRVHQLKSLDWAARRASFVEKAPAEIVQQALDVPVAIFEDE